MSFDVGTVPGLAPAIAGKNVAALGHAGWLAVGFTVPFLLLYRLTSAGYSNLMMSLTLLCGLTGGILVSLSRRRSSWVSVHSGALTIGFFLLVGCTLALGGLLQGGYESCQYLGLMLVAAASQLFLWDRRETILAFGILYVFWVMPLLIGLIEVHNAESAVEQQFFIVAVFGLSAFFARRRWIEARRERLIQSRCLRLAKCSKRQAETDSLTGLGNRFWFMAASQREFGRIRRDGGRLTVVAIDIDWFKRVNDELGHAAGDRVLRQVAETLQGVVRRGDIIARMGGDEFILLLTDADQHGAIRAAERIRSAVAARAVTVKGGEVRCTVSAGVAEVDPQAEGVEFYLSLADEALYRAKSEGRDRVAECGSQTRWSTEGGGLDKLDSELLASPSFI